MMPPSVSVVVASGAGGDFLFRCLDSLRDEAGRESARVLVPDRVGGATAERLSRDYPWVDTIDATKRERRASVPELRAFGAEKARGDLVAILEEHCTAPPGWVAAIRAGFRPGDAAIGGPILDRGYERLRDWCVYFSEYNNYLPPWPDGERYLLNGANVAYNRALLAKHAGLLTSGYWEVVLHPVLAREGKFRAHAPMGVHHTGPFDYGYYLEQRYLLSRVWGGTQRTRVGAAKRGVYLLLGPLLPFLLYARTAMRVARSGAPKSKFVLASPLLIGALCAYVWGEWLGYLVGTGDSLERVE